MSDRDETVRVRKALEADFEEFVSVAAHNLREPLRDVASFSQLMAETHAGRLDADAGELLERIGQGAAKTQSLLTDMVAYAAAGTGEPRLGTTDMEAVLNQALLCADQQIVERTAIVTHDPLPVVWSDFETLTKVLYHLIRNAIEYCDTTAPRVHISSRQVDSDVVFSVKDNGPGIEAQFHGRIFIAFKRLHGREYPGNGLGLAYCRKAIEALGGRIWLESTPGAGSTFYFALPADD
ncbi:MAG: ATP-binding protein [Candidatus Solibacter sp.]